MNGSNRMTALLFVGCAIAVFVACGGGTQPTPATPVEGPAARSEHDGEGQSPSIPHPVQGREQCTSCHAEAGKPSSAEPMPADHAGRTDGTCLECHKPAGG